MIGLTIIIELTVGALGRIIDVFSGRAACEECSKTWILGTNSAFALGSRKTTENW
jgi:hypothetical protein